LEWVVCSLPDSCQKKNMVGTKPIVRKARFRHGKWHRYENQKGRLGETKKKGGISRKSPWHEKVVGGVAECLEVGGENARSICRSSEEPKAR